MRVQAELARVNGSIVIVQISSLTERRAYDCMSTNCGLFGVFVTFANLGACAVVFPDWQPPAAHAAWYQCYIDSPQARKAAHVPACLISARDSTSVNALLSAHANANVISVVFVVFHCGVRSLAVFHWAMKT